MGARASFRAGLFKKPGGAITAPHSGYHEPTVELFWINSTISFDYRRNANHTWNYSFSFQKKLNALGLLSLDIDHGEAVARSCLVSNLSCLIQSCKDEKMSFSGASFGFSDSLQLFDDGFIFIPTHGLL